ncbi:MAG: DUF952 domain-containing protein [Polyangiaceae bacterium]
MRWFYHLVRRPELVWNEEDRYAPPSLTTEGFVHASYLDAVESSARLHFPGDAPDSLVVLAVDPRRIDARVDEAETPRGPMPHVHGSIPRDAVRVLDWAGLAGAPDRVTGTRCGFVAFSGLTLLDLVGPLDALSRIASMGFDGTTTTEVFALDSSNPTWSGSGASFRVERFRPPLTEFDLLVIPGGFGTRPLVDDHEALAYLRTYPENRLLASVCTGALVVGALGRLQGKPATTHASALDELARHGASPRRERVVSAGQVMTAGGVTSGIELGLELVRRLTDDDTARAIARQMEVRGPL